MGTPYISLDGVWEAFASYNTMVNNRLLAHAIGRDEALLFQTLLSKRTYYLENDKLDEDGFFYSTVDDLQESTTLSKYQQSQACKKLEKIGLIEVKLKGLPATRHFRIIKDDELMASLLNKGLEISMSYKRKRTENRIDSQMSKNLTSCSKETEQQDYNAKKDLENRRNSKMSKNLTSCGKETEQQEVEFFDNNRSRNFTSGGQKTGQQDVQFFDTKLNNKTNINNLNNQSINQSTDRKTERGSETDYSTYQEIIKENIMYDDLVKSRFKYRIDELDEIVELITELVAINKSAVKINGTDVPPELVKARFLKLNEGNIIDFFDRYENITEEIKNTRAYMISMLFNTKTTSAHYYTNQYKSDQ